MKWLLAIVLFGIPGLVSARQAVERRFTVAYAIEADGKRDSGTIEHCVRGRPCEVRSPILGFDLRFIVESDRPILDLMVRNATLDCCRFNEGGPTITRSFGTGVQHVVLLGGQFEGFRHLLTAGASQVRPQKIGDLYFALSGAELAIEPKL